MYKERKPKSPERALASLMRLASRAEKSSGDALRLMRTWGLSDDDAHTILDKLIELQFIDDQRFALAYVREKTRLAGWGSYKIRSGLMAKRIAPEIIDHAFSELEDRDREDGQERLERYLERKLRSIKSADSYEIRNKLIRYGLSQGHRFDDISPIIDKIISAKNE